MASQCTAHGGVEGPRQQLQPQDGRSCSRPDDAADAGPPRVTRTRTGGEAQNVIAARNWI
jgi:hypothetical protein